MSTTDQPETTGENQQTDQLTRIKEKLNVQQRLIDISLRNLQSSRLSSRSNLHSHSSSSSLLNGYQSGGENQSSLLEGNLREKEVSVCCLHAHIYTHCILINF